MTGPTDAVEIEGTPFASLIKTLAELDVRKREVEAEMESIKAQLRAELKRGTYTIQGVPALSLKPTRRFDPKKAETLLANRPDLLEQVQVKVVDTKLARQKLAPEVYELCQTEGPKDTVQLG